MASLHLNPSPLLESDFTSLRLFKASPTRLVIHHTATGEGATVRNIHEAHRGRGFAGIGYHALIHANGVLQIGRPPAYRGAGVKNHNADTLHLALIGDGRQGFRRLQWQKLRHAVEWFWETHPDGTVWGHRDLAATLCPGFDVTDWLRAGMRPGRIRE